MKVFKILILLFLISSNYINLSAQTSLFTFDGTDLGGWTIPSGFDDVGSEFPLWTVDELGSAPSSNWNDRNPIASDSEGGALVFNPDSLNSLNATLPEIIQATSPIFDVPTDEKVFLTFHQYYKSFQGSTKVEILAGNTNELLGEYPINLNYGDFTETNNNDAIFINISNAISLSNGTAKIRFTHEGVGSFWIIDDIQLETAEMVLNNQLKTFPLALADTLCDNNYPFLTDTLGGAYIPHEIVLQWEVGATEADKQMTRNTFGIGPNAFETCTCDTLELWKIPIEITPVKIGIVDGDIPNGDVDIDFNETFVSIDGCQEFSYSVVDSMSHKCSEFSEFNFYQHTPIDQADSQMIAIEGGIGAGFTLPTPNLQADTTYVLSFYGRKYFNTISPILEISVGTEVFDTVTIDVDLNWVRYDVKLPISVAGLINITQINSGGEGYAIDDVCIFRYMLGDGQGIDLNGVIETVKTCGTVKESDPNYYNLDLLEANAPILPVPEITTLPPPFSTINNGEKVVAILDTGIDYRYNTADINIVNYLYRSADTICYPNDNYGYSFVEKDGMQSVFDTDRAGHGTHIAGIILQNMKDSLDCGIKLLPVKTHDTLGIGTLFRVCCGMEFARLAGADFINASWGYYGEKSDIMENVIESLGIDDDIMVVCSAGNSGEDIGVKKHYPSSLELDNLITVAALNTNGDALVSSSNYSSNFVEFATLGENVASSVPPHTSSSFTIQKTGTSMAAPRLLSAAVMTECNCPIATPYDVKGILKEIATEITLLENKIRAGRIINTDSFYQDLLDNNCTSVPIEDVSNEIKFSVFPNPAHDFLNIRLNTFPEESLTLEIYDITGRILLKDKLESSEKYIYLEKIKPGIYFLKISNKKSFTTKKIIKF